MSSSTSAPSPTAASAAAPTVDAESAAERELAEQPAAADKNKVEEDPDEEEEEGEAGELDEDDDEDEDGKSRRDVFVGNLSLYSDELRVRDHFSRFGAVSDVRVMSHPDTGKSRRFGFVTFARAADADAAIRGGGGDGGPNRHFLDGKVLQVRPAVKRNKDPSPSVNTNARTKSESVGGGDGDGFSKVFVGGIGQDATAEDVERLMRDFGAVDRVQLLRDREQTGRHRGFAFVTFAGGDEASAAAAAALACRQRHLTLRGRTVEVKRAKPRPPDDNRRATAPAATSSLLGEHPLQSAVSQALAAAAVISLQQQLQQQSAAAVLAAQQQQQQLQQQLLWPTALPAAATTTPIVTSAPSVRYAPYTKPEHLGRRQQQHHDAAAAAAVAAAPTAAVDLSAVFQPYAAQPLMLPVWQQQPQQYFHYPAQNPK